MQPTLLITCEHGGYRVPPRYAAQFRGQQRVLTSHRGYDPGALELARRLSRELDAPLFASTVTRLLVELNRSVGHPRLFSEFTRDTGRRTRSSVCCGDYYLPHRQLVTDWLQQQTPLANVIHISVHSFTPRLRGETRRADVGLLYDPARSHESQFCRSWQQQLRRQRPGMPGTSQLSVFGQSGWLHDRPAQSSSRHARYVGIELEVNQRWVRQGGAGWRQLQSDLIATLAVTRQEFAAANTRSR